MEGFSEARLPSSSKSRLTNDFSALLSKHYSPSSNLAQGVCGRIGVLRHITVAGNLNLTLNSATVPHNQLSNATDAY